MMRICLTLVPLMLLAMASCSGRGSNAPASPRIPGQVASAAAARSAPARFISPSLLIPDLPRDSPSLGHEPDGSRRAIIAQMRVVEHLDGSIERAESLLPSAHARLISLELPSRLGGGFAFISSGDSSAQLWRASSWLAALEPVVSTTQPVHEAIAGFDRLYVRHARNGPLYGLDLDKGEYTDFSGLPLPTRTGAAWFADAWRAVVVTDLRGPLATFDAGASWFPLGLRSPVIKVEGAGDGILLSSRDDRWMLSSEGVLTAAGPAGASRSGPQPAAATSSKPSPHAGALPDGPLGHRPLRLALERGMPLDSAHAVVAHDGHIAVVQVTTGRVAELHRSVYPRSFAECNAIPLGTGIGFVCGERNGATAVFRLDRPARMPEVMRWSAPRAIFPSGNGALVARAPCPGAEPVEGLSQYCVRNVAGLVRELRFKGDVGAERVAALADGRIAILIAPRPGAEGRLVILQGEKATAFVLDFQTVPRPVVEMVRRGMWLNGMQELGPGSLGVWVEAGGPVVGLRIDDKGRVSAGPVQKTTSDTGDAIVSGRFGLVWRSAGRGLESTDGGVSWNEVELPTVALRSAPDRRACSAVGCVAGGWMRVGWGPPRHEHDMEPPRKPPARYLQQRSAKALRLQCEFTGRTSPPAATVPAQRPQAPARPPVRYGYGHGGMVAVAPAGYGYWQAARWLPFGPMAAPALGPDEEGLSTTSRDYGELKPYRVYVWGPKASDWTRTGHWLIRFDDPYDATALPRSTLTAVSPWSDISLASSVLNSRSDQLWFDPEMRSGVIGWCTGAKQCRYFGIAPQELPVPFSSDSSVMPQVSSAIRSDDTWYLLVPGVQELELWQVNLSGTASRIGSFPRQEYGDQVTLVRRARTPGVGLLTASPLPGRMAAEWVVLPLDSQSGAIVDAVRLGPVDLEGRVPPPCAEGQDGWQIESFPGAAPSIGLPGQVYVSDARLRLRADPGRFCVAGLTGRVRRPEGTGPWPARAAAPAGPGLMLSVLESEQGRKLQFSCRPSDDLSR